MTDKEKFRKEVEKLKSNLIYGACSSQIAMETRCKEEAYDEVLALLDTMQEEPAPKIFEDMLNAKTPAESLGISAEEHDKIIDLCLYGKEPEMVDIDDLPKEEPVSKDYRERYKRIAESEQFKKIYEGMSVGEVMHIEGEEPVSEELEEASENYALNNTPWDDCKDEIQESFKDGAKWKEQQMMKKAVDGYVIKDIEEGNGDFLLSADYLPKSMGLKDQQRVKVIVIKKN